MAQKCGLIPQFIKSGGSLVERIPDVYSDFVTFIKNHELNNYKPDFVKTWNRKIFKYLLMPYFYMLSESGVRNYLESKLKEDSDFSKKLRTYDLSEFSKFVYIALQEFEPVFTNFRSFIIALSESLLVGGQKNYFKVNSHNGGLYSWFTKRIVNTGKKIKQETLLLNPVTDQDLKKPKQGVVIQASW
jgi:hypothetical protein